MNLRASFLLPALLAASATSFAQSNSDPKIDLLLAAIDDLTAMGRTGIYPNGVNGCAFATTACNVGTKEIPWQQAMDPDHPFIAFLLARESNGRFEQISDRSYVKHGFFALSSSFCGTCTPTDGTKLGLGCSDTYATGNNGDMYWLAPPDEIDPWLGAWDPVCSHFDRGEPPVAPPNDCNGLRSLTQTQAQNLGDVAHRIRVKDVEFDVPGAAFWFQGMYVIETENESRRGDNIGSRGFTPVWSGSRWNLNESGSLLHGSVLQRWSGATLDSVVNGTDDGRVYLASKVTGPVDGFYHYEIAVHNRDNARGIGALRIPVCPEARVRDIGFSDVDADAGNDWTGAHAGNEIVFSGAAAPLRWNTLYNFWFDSDAEPISKSLSLDQADPGPGLATLSLSGQAPMGLFNVFAGAGCALDTPPTLHATGIPPRATIGNASFALRSTGNTPNQPHTLYYSLASGSHMLGSCTVYLGPSSASARFAGRVITDANGVAVHPAPIANNIALEGVVVHLQAAVRDPGNGTLFGDFELSDALSVRVGSSLGDCP